MKSPRAAGAKVTVVSPGGSEAAIGLFQTHQHGPTVETVNISGILSNTWLVVVVVATF